jgi:hypothetical protein
MPGLGDLAFRENVMYAVVRRYTGAPALVILDEVARRQADVEEVIRGVPGFVAYYLIRSGEIGASVTVCQDQAGTTESTRRAADWIRANVPAAAGTPPEVTEGEVMIHFGP